MTDTTPRALARTDEPEPDPYAGMMREAIAQGEAGVAALERLVALQERREAQQAEREFNAAIARFQAACPPIAKLDRGQHGMYARRNRIMKIITPVLAAEGLSVTFDSEDHGDSITLLTHVRHSGGHRETSHIKIRKEANIKTRDGRQRINEPQADGSALEYAQRYGLGQALGITTGDADTDGASTSDRPSAETVTDDQAATLEALVEEVAEDKAAFLARAKVERFNEFPLRMYARAISYLEGKR